MEGGDVRGGFIFFKGGFRNGMEIPAGLDHLFFKPPQGPLNFFFHIGAENKLPQFFSPVNDGNAMR
jgi:hypothetical protein